MSDFRNYIEIKEDIQYEETLTESAEFAAAAILGIPTIGLLAAWGGSLAVLAYSKGITKIVNVWYKIGQNFHELKGRKAMEYLARVKKDPLVHQEVSKGISNKREYDDVLKELYQAIENKDFITLKEKYDALTPAFRKMPAVKQIIINEITKTLGEPPLWPPTPGNKTYKTIRNVLGLQEAKAAAAAVVYSAKKTMGQEESTVEEGIVDNFVIKNTLKKMGADFYDDGDLIGKLKTLYPDKSITNLMVIVRSVRKHKKEE